MAVGIDMGMLYTVTPQRQIVDSGWNPAWRALGDMLDSGMVRGEGLEVMQEFTAKGAERPVQWNYDIP